MSNFDPSNRYVLDMRKMVKHWFLIRQMCGCGKVENVCVEKAYPPKEGVWLKGISLAY
jgi:hypothetical protein